MIKRKEPKLIQTIILINQLIQLKANKKKIQIENK